MGAAHSIGSTRHRRNRAPPEIPTARRGPRTTPNPPGRRPQRSSLSTGSGSVPAFHSTIRQPRRPGSQTTHEQLLNPPNASQ
ncbi:hypothetical protein SAMN05421678_116139 [Actinopolymorpha cephalotaxi]|uniref:Uncharacterized protein n=1 Tax=Actinopolymorpha cephalotaxi TaxID=504797 RepID=A0A1I2ZJA8_9ACTN|nr:hypothetical protein SAMN05421678_116139 [Actinopolymorpha cephalotaxi]